MRNEKGEGKKKEGCVPAFPSSRDFRILTGKKKGKEKKEGGGMKMLVSKSTSQRGGALAAGLFVKKMVHLNHVAYEERGKEREKKGWFFVYKTLEFRRQGEEERSKGRTPPTTP